MIEARTTDGWVGVGPWSDPPTVAEFGDLAIRGLPPGATVSAGGVDLPDASVTGRCEVVLARTRLRDAVGLVVLVVDGSVVGEIEIAARKIGPEEFDRLRAELRAVWADLLFDERGSAAVRAVGVPDAAAIWRDVRIPVGAIARAPLTRLEPQARRMPATRWRPRSGASPRELLMASAGGLAMLPDLALRPSAPENGALRDGLRRLMRLAERQPGAAQVVREVQEALAAPHLQVQKRTPGADVPMGARRDSRYRRVLEVLGAVQGARTRVVEGPGELRLGLRALPKLYEYWVFLSVVRQAVDAFGPPLDPGLDVLAVPLAGGGVRAVLPAGTEVAFHNGVVVRYDPSILDSRPDHDGLRLRPHRVALPAELTARGACTPDVLVLRRGRRPAVIVIDAKYCEAGVVDKRLTQAWLRYSRIAHADGAAVRQVCIASPHDGAEFAWPGCRALRFLPGSATDQIPFDLLDAGYPALSPP